MSYEFYDKKWILDYVKWLDKFSNENKAFTDDRWIYKAGTISDLDFNKLSELYILYIKLEEYALNNQINLETGDFGSYYKLAINDHAGFYIGYMANQGRIIFCVKKDNIDLDNWILFDDLLEKNNSSVNKRTLILS